MKKYFYKVEDGICTEPCPINNKIMIGSENCSRCKNFWKGGVRPHYPKSFVECSKLN